MHTEILTIETPELFEAAAQKAADLLKQGEIVALPTETVYGLAGSIWNGKAINKIFSTKGRPAHNPLIVHVASIEMARQCTMIWPNTAELLARTFWPGPLTIVLDKRPNILPIITARGETVALRWPAHPFTQAVIKKARVPLAAPSANLSNRVSPTTADHVRRDLWGKIPLIIDAGPCGIGIESTVVDLTIKPFRILRPGMINSEQIAAAVGAPAASFVEEKAAPLKSPGQLEKHYSPKARLLILQWNNSQDLVHQLTERGVGLDHLHVVAHDRIPEHPALRAVSLIPDDPEAYARALYAQLHHSDELGAHTIIVEQVPDSPAWEGIRDRLKRAAAG